jgi:HKD family nuclease
MTRLIHNPHGVPRLGELLVARLDSGEWAEFSAAVAFVKSSGVQYLSEALKRFGDNGGVVRIAVGVDALGTTYEGLDLLLRSISGDAVVTVVHNENGSTFHPKLYLVESSEKAELIVGSGNFTAGGLYRNYEAGLLVALTSGSAPDDQILNDIRARFTEWTTPDGSIVQRLTPELLESLHREGYILRELEDRRRRERERAEARSRFTSPKRLFGSVPVPPVPPRPKGGLTKVRASARESEVEPAAQSVSAARGFVMTLQQTDVGVGQTTPGKARRSPEIFIPLSARDADPQFWGWQAKFKQDPTNPKKFDRSGVSMRLGTDLLNVNMMTWPAKHDFRLRSEALRSAGSVGDILRIEWAESGSDFEYYVEVIPKGTSLYDSYLRLCTQKTRNSSRMWGYYS